MHPRTQKNAFIPGYCLFIATYKESYFWIILSPYYFSQNMSLSCNMIFLLKYSCALE